MVKKPPEMRKKFFSFFYNFFHIFPLPLRKKKQNHLLFPPFLSLEIEKPQGKTSHKKFFFFFFYLTFLDPTDPRNQKNYHLPFFLKFRLKVPQNAYKRAQVSFFTNYLCSAVFTRTHIPTDTHSVFPTHYG